MTVRDIIILGCSAQQPTRFRNHGAYLFRWNEEGLLFDPGEGTQRQFIFANISPTCVTRIFVSHFHGDHCLGVGSMLMRLNLDKVTHPIHCYYPASGKKCFERLRYGTLYHETINVVEYPVLREGLVHEDPGFRIESIFLEHSVDNIGWRVTEPDRRKFDKEKLAKLGIRGLMVKTLQEEKVVKVGDKKVYLDDVSSIKKGDSIAVVIDTRFCQNAIDIARGAKVLLCESTYQEEHKELAYSNYHLTAKQAAIIAKEAEVDTLILTHFSARYLNLSTIEKEAKSIFPNTVIAEDFKRIPFKR